MFLNSSLSLICPGYFLYSKPQVNGYGNNIFLSSKHMKVLALFFRYSLIFKKSMLLDIEIRETNTAGLVYLYSYNIQNYVLRLISFTGINSGSTVSISNIFHNAAWLERELRDNYAVLFKGLRDRRSLFNLPLFFNGVKRKGFPMNGFYELRWNTYTNSLTFFRAVQI